MYEQLKAAQVAYRGQVLKIVSSFGVASLGHDSAASIEDLIKLALQRLQRASASAGVRIVGAEDIGSIKVASIPVEIERAIQVLEKINAERLGLSSGDMLLRLLPFLQSAFKQLKIDLPWDKIAALLKSKK
jgi:hypothetical protein